MGDWEEQDDFPGDLSLHSDPLTPEAVPCTPANAVEVHRDSEPGEENPLLGCMKQKCHIFAITVHLYVQFFTKLT